MLADRCVYKNLQHGVRIGILVSSITIQSKDQSFCEVIIPMAHGQRIAICSVPVLFIVSCIKVIGNTDKTAPLITSGLRLI